MNAIFGTRSFPICPVLALANVMQQGAARLPTSPEGSTRASGLLTMLVPIDSKPLQRLLKLSPALLPRYTFRTPWLTPLLSRSWSSTRSDPPSQSAYVRGPRRLSRGVVSVPTNTAYEKPSVVMFLSTSWPGVGKKVSRDASYRVPAAPGSSKVSVSETSGTPAAPAGVKNPHQNSNEIGRLELSLI